MTSVQFEPGLLTCPDCHGTLNFTIEGFRPASDEERRNLTPHAIRVLGLCPNPACPSKAIPTQRAR